MRKRDFIYIGGVRLRLFIKLRSSSAISFELGSVFFRGHQLVSGKRQHRRAERMNSLPLKRMEVHLFPGVGN